MGFGGPDIPPAPDPVPTRQLPDAGILRKDLLERLKRARGRAASRVVEPGLLEEANTYRPTLSSIVGG
jgi:hypothetical protein